MEKLFPRIETVPVIQGRVVDSDSAKRARGRCRRYRLMTILMLLLLFPFLVVIVLGRIYGWLSFPVGLLVFPLFCALLTVYGYYGTKQYSYTGRSGYEQLDPDGSPFLGKLVNPKGHIRLQSFLWLVGMFLLATVISLLYLWRYPSANQIGKNLWGNAKRIFSCLGFLFSLLFGFGGFLAVGVYGTDHFFDRLKVFLRKSLPVYLFVQLVILLVSALAYYLMAHLSAGNAAAEGVTQTLASRILGEAYDTGSPAKMLFGEHSILTSLSAAALYFSLFDTVTDHLEEEPEPFGKQFKNMILDKDLRLTWLMLLLSILYIGVSRFASLPTVLSWIVRIVILCAWLYSSYKSIVGMRLIHWLTCTAAVVLVDQLFILPAVTNVWTGLLAIPALLLRAAGFLTVAVLMGFYYKQAEDASALSQDPNKKLDLTNEKTIGEMWKEK